MHDLIYDLYEWRQIDWDVIMQFIQARAAKKDQLAHWSCQESLVKQLDRCQSTLTVKIGV